MSNELVPRVRYAGGWQPRSIETDYDYRNGFYEGEAHLLAKILKLPKEIRHIIYSELLWGKEVWRANNRIDGGLNLTRHPRQDRSSLFLDTSGVMIPPRFIRTSQAWSEVQHDRFKLRTGLTTTIQRKDHVHLIHLIKSLQKLENQNGTPDMRVLVDFLTWFWGDIVVDLGKDSQYPLSDDDWKTPYSLAATLKPLHYKRIANLSLSFNSGGVTGASYHKYSRSFCRVCHFVARELKLTYLSLWLDFLHSDVELILENPSEEAWIAAFKRIEVKERFDMKLGLRWKLPTAEELKGYGEKEFEDGMRWGVDMEVVQEMTVKLKKLLMPISLTFGEDIDGIEALEDEWP